MWLIILNPVLIEGESVCVNRVQKVKRVHEINGLSRWLWLPAVGGEGWV